MIKLKMNNNYKKITAILSIAMLCINLDASSFSQSKKILLNKIYFDNQYTFYCGNPGLMKKMGC